MNAITWTVLAILAISWNDVDCRSIDASITSESATASPLSDGEKETITEVVETAAEILTVEVMGEAVEKAAEEAIQREADAKKKAVAELMKNVEKEAVKEIIVDEISSKPQTLGPLLNIPATLEFEAGTNDKDNEIAGPRGKRTVGQIGRMAQCVFTILVNPNCFNEVRASNNRGGGGGIFAGLFGGARSSTGGSSSRQEAYNRQLRQWMEYQRRQIAKLNATEGGNYTTPFPILPPSPPPEDDEDTTQRPGGFIQNAIQFKLNLIPNLFRTARSLMSSILPFIQNIGQGIGGGGGGAGGGILGSLSSLTSSLTGGGGGSFGNNYDSDSISSYRPSSSSSGSSSDSSSGSSNPETSTYRISLG